MAIIAAEPTSPGTLVTDYVVPLAAVGAIAGVIGGSMAWIASALQIVPLLGVFAFFAALYGLYLL